MKIPKLFKRSDEPDAPWYLSFMHKRKQYMKSLRTSDHELAVTRAIEIKTGITSGDWTSSRKNDCATFEQLSAVYNEHSSHLSERTREANMKSLLKLFNAKETDSTQLIQVERLNEQLAKLEEAGQAMVFNNRLRNAKSVFRRDIMRIYTQRLGLPSGLGELINFPYSKMVPGRPDISIEMLGQIIDSAVSAGRPQDLSCNVWLYFLLLAAGLSKEDVQFFRWDHFHTDQTGGVYYRPQIEFSAPVRRRTLNRAILEKIFHEKQSADITLLRSEQKQLTKSLNQYLKKIGFDHINPVSILLKMCERIDLSYRQIRFSLPPQLSSCTYYSPPPLINQH